MFPLGDDIVGILNLSTEAMVEYLKTLDPQKSYKLREMVESSRGILSDEMILDEMVKLSKKQNVGPSIFMPIYYTATNENRKMLTELLELKNKDMLIVSAAGDQFLSHICDKNFKDSNNRITCFDINPITFKFSNLKFNAMKTFEDHNMFNSLILNKVDNNNFLDVNNLEKVVGGDFWIKYLEAINFDRKIVSNLFKYKIGELENNFDKISPFYEENGYNKTREILLKRSLPEFYSCDFLNIGTTVPGQFDVIDLSNIIEDIVESKREEEGAYYPEDDTIIILNDIIRKISPKLKDDGIIIVDYCLDTSINLPSWIVLRKDPRLKIYEFNSGFNDIQSGIAVYQKKV